MKKYLISLAAALFVASPVVADDKPVLTIYTYESFTTEWGPGPAIETAFEAQCDCDVNFVSLDSSIGILGRVQLEGASSPADIVLGLDTNLTDIAEQTGLFQPHGSQMRADNLPIDYESDIFMPFDWGYFAFVYDKNRMAQPPQSLEALIAADDDLRIVIQDPRTATPGLGFLLWMKSVYGDEAASKWEALNPKIVTVTKGWWDAYSLFLEGEADMVMSYSTSPAYHQIAEGVDNYAAAAFEEGHYMQIEVAAILKNAPQADLAKSFMDFMQGPVFQGIIPTTNWMYPTQKSSVPEGFAGLIQPKKSYLFSAKEVADSKQIWVDEWLSASVK
ncbi:MAG: thiamine ABC transporter substrate binding subunit [Candidatus Puniceispirillaceae bacterium]